MLAPRSHSARRYTSQLVVRRDRVCEFDGIHVSTGSIPRDIVDPREKGNEGLSRREMHACALEGLFRSRIPARSQLRPATRYGIVCIPQLHIPNHLPACAPDGLEEAVLLCEPVEAVVGLAHGADETADGVGLVVAGVAAVLVNLANAELDRGVVLGPDDASGGRLVGISIAFRGQVGGGR